MPDEEFRIIAKVRLVIENIEEIKKEVANITGGIKAEPAGGITKGGGVIGRIVGKITQIFSKIPESIEKWIGRIVSRASSTVGGVLERADKFSEQFEELLGLRKGGAEPTPTGGGARARGGARAGGASVLTVLLVIFLIVEILKGIFDAVKKIVKFLANASPILKSVIDMFKLALQLFFMPFGNILGILLRPLAIFLIRVAVMWIKIFRPLEKFLIALTKDPVGTIIKVLQDIWNKLTSLFSSLWELLVTTIVNTITTLINTIVSTASSMISSFVNTVSSAVTNFANTIINAITSLGNYIWNGITSMTSSIVDAIMRLPGEIGNAIVNALSGAGKSIMEGSQKFFGDMGKMLNITGW